MIAISPRGPSFAAGVTTAQALISYFPQAYRNDLHSKLLLMAPSYDRSGTLGFVALKKR